MDCGISVQLKEVVDTRNWRGTRGLGRKASGTVGAKILYIINGLEFLRGLIPVRLSQPPAILQAGGSLSGGLIGVRWRLRQAVSRKHKMPALATSTAFFTCWLWARDRRVGMLFAAGCCYGKADACLLGVTFTNSLAHVPGQ